MSGSLRQSGLLLLLPDLMVTGTWPELWRRLKTVNTTIVAVTAIKLTPARMAALYADSRAKPHNRSRPTTSLGWNLGSLDMSIPLVIRVPHDIDLTDMLDRWKGPSEYGKRKPDDLRQAWPSANRCASLLHSPDHQDLLRRDLARLFGKGAAWLLENAGTLPPITPDTVPRLRMRLTMVDEPHPYDIVLRTMIRGLSLLGYDAQVDTLPQRPRYEHQIEALLSFRARLARDLASGHIKPQEVFALVAVELTRVRGALPIKPPRLLPVGRIEAAADWEGRLLQVKRGALLAVIHGLAQPSRWSELTAEEVVAAYDSNGLVLDRWEVHLLSTALVFGPAGER